MRSKEHIDKLTAFINSMDDPNSPSPPITYRVWPCPKCSLQFSTTKYGWSSRLRTFGRSDGKVDSNSKRVPNWIFCPHCKSPIDFYNPLSFEGKEEQLIEGSQALNKAPLHLLLEPSDFINLANSFNSEQEDIQKFYVYAWHRFNDLREIENRWTLTDKDGEFLKLILSRLTDGGGQQSLYKAELLRELGRFEEAIKALDREFCEEELESHAEQIMRAVELADDKPFLFASKERDGHFEFMMAWRTRRYVPEILDELDGIDKILNPPIFKISNRNWWVKILGMLSHNWALIEENFDNSATVYFFQDTPEPSRPAVIDSLNFSNIEDALEGLEKNHFSLLKKTPGPWLGDVPKGHIYDHRSAGNLIYSKFGYWQD